MVGREESVIRHYIRTQEQEDKGLDQLNVCGAVISDPA